MENTKVMEKELHPINGVSMLISFILGLLLSTAVFAAGVVGASENKLMTLSIVGIVAGVVGWVAFLTLMAGLKTVKPNEARVLTLFGKYYGTIRQPGFFYVNPFCGSSSPTYNVPKVDAESKGQTVMVPANPRKCISLKTQTLDNRRQKVNDVLGNPIIVGAVVIWRVKDPTQAVFSVENYMEYLSIQADSTVRNIARLYPYDTFEDNEEDENRKETTLRGSSIEIAESMKKELQKRVAGAGLEIEEVRITHLAYAEEIAAAMLQRQQAVAVIAARQKIVDGAVGMVKMAIDRLGEDEIVVLDEERKAAMVSNLLVVLCGNKEAQPILNSGSIY